MCLLKLGCSSSIGKNVPVILPKRWSNGKELAPIAGAHTLEDLADMASEMNSEDRNDLIDYIKELRRIDRRQNFIRFAVYNAMPFIGFGFLDNLIMIIAGDYIDYTIGTAFGISTMAAAALGNTVSDVAGIGSAYYVEMLASRIGVVQPSLNQAQLDMRSATIATNLGRALGVVLGCLIGMFPLLFLPQKEKESEGDPPVT